MKRLAEIAKDKGIECLFVRAGKNHDVYRVGDRQFPVPRHREINENTARGIIKTATEAK